MDKANDPEFLAALRNIFVSREDMQAILDYQRRLYASLKELNDSHRAVHQHVRSLTESHNTVRADANTLIRHRNEISEALRDLAEAHRQTRGEIRRSIEAISFIQQQISKIPDFEARITRLEQK